MVSVIKASSLAVLVFDVPAAVPFTGIELYKQFVAANLGTLISQRLLENEDKIRFEKFSFEKCLSLATLEQLKVINN